MILDDNQKKDMLDKLNQRWKSKVCGVCGSTNWAVTDRIFQLMEFHEGALVVGGQVVPLINVHCSSCGHTLFFNAILLGLVTSKKLEESSNA
jgi:hypothetical protein